MFKIEFNYNQHITTIQANINEPFKNVINKFLQKSQIEPKHFFFIANGKPIIPENTIASQITKMNKEKQILKTLVQSIKESTAVKSYVKSKDVICIECYEPCRMQIKNYKISLFGCKKNHINYLKIKDFFDSQIINISNINCDTCKINNKGNSKNKGFYKCLTCKKNLCFKCKTTHESNHYKIDFDNINYICENHFEYYINYCLNCNKNICFLCTDEHRDHNIISLNDLMPNIDDIKHKLKEMKNEIDIFNNSIKEIINELNDLIESMKLYYEININIFKNYEKKNRNYQILQNINQINNNNEIFHKLKNINEMNNIKDKLNNIMDLYNNINSDNNEIKTEIKKSYKEDKFINNNISSSLYKVNQMNIIYNIPKNTNKIKLFGSSFVKNNKNNCYLLIDEEFNELCESFELNSKQKNQNKFNIKLIEMNSISNMSFMFSDCSLLSSLPDISKWNMENVNDIRGIFCECESLKSLSDISNWNTKNITNMSWMFNYCTSLISLPDISKWNTINVTNMSGIFSYCSSLKSLPDISKWNTTNVTDMNNMFIDCKSLLSLPDISKWNTTNVTNMNNMFNNCSSLITLPDISNWNTTNLTGMSYMFLGCKSLISQPDISKWNTKNVIIK